MNDAGEGSVGGQDRRVAVVTGSSGLIGSAVCARLRSAGARIVGIDAGYAAAPASGTPPVTADLGDAAQAAEAFATVDREYGRLDWLVHAAAFTGGSSPIDLSGPISAVDIDTWRRVLDINLTAALVCVQNALPLLRRSTDARIVLIGSIQGLVPTIDSGAYAVSKAALTGLTSQLAIELAAEGIVVNMISPGSTVRIGVPGDPARPPNPMGRFCGADEMAASIVGVLTTDSRFMTGAVIPVDGGEHLRPRRGPIRPQQ